MREINIERKVRDWRAEAGRLRAEADALDAKISVALELLSGEDALEDSTEDARGSLQGMIRIALEKGGWMSADEIERSVVAAGWDTQAKSGRKAAIYAAISKMRAAGVIETNLIEGKVCHGLVTTKN